MLIEFTVGNFASFKEPISLSMVAAKIHSKNKIIDEENVIPIDKDLTLLTSVAIYGPNASGKSNLIAAAKFTRHYVLHCVNNPQLIKQIRPKHFRLSTETADKPSFFEFVFLIDGHQYRYGFEIDFQKVVSEWLYYVPKAREIKLFERLGSDVLPNMSNIHAREFRNIKTLLNKINQEEPLPPSTLFLSVAAQNNGPESRKILDWFSNMGFISGLNDDQTLPFTLNQFRKPEYRDKIIDLVKKLDLGIQQIEMQSIDSNKFLEGAPEFIRELIDKTEAVNSVVLLTLHEKFNAQGEVVGYEKWDLEGNESEGTKKLFFMSGPIIDTLTKGRILWVDEMEARLHPEMTQKIVELFNSHITNPKRAQLIFTTHETSLLDIKKLRRDQIWFIDKDRTAASRLYSLVEFNIRNDDASLEADYLRGSFGATPHIYDLITAS
jgi:AAA15 family ATPase/GTPase